MAARREGPGDPLRRLEERNRALFETNPHPMWIHDLETLLELGGFRVLTTANGRLALELVRARGDEIAPVLLDVTMPELSGADTLREIHRLRPDVAEILMTDYHEDEAIGRVDAQRVARFVPKPFRATELVALVRSELERVARRQRARGGR